MNNVTIQERARIQAIDAIANSIDPALVNEAKYGPNMMTAEQLALKAMHEGRVMNGAFLFGTLPGVTAMQQKNNRNHSEEEYDLTNPADLDRAFQTIAAEKERIRAQRNPMNF